MNWLCEIYDKLERAHVRMISVMVGQRTLEEFRDNYIERGNGVLIDRHMRKCLEFFGVRNIDQMIVVLNGYDTITESDPDWPFTRFFFPEAYAAGFRMQDAAELIWGEFTKAIEAHNKVTECAIPMKHLTMFVETLFEDYFSLDEPGFKLERGFVADLIDETGFELYLDALANPPSRRE